MRIILASKSPRRSEILNNIGVKFEIITADTDESSDITDAPKLVEQLSSRKAAAVKQLMINNNENLIDTLIIAADTVVACNGEILGKPKNDDDAKRMLYMLSGHSHSVVSGITLIFNGVSISDHCITKVDFADMSEQDIEFYVNSKEPCDKAGAYAIQGLGSMWISGICGCYFNVMGLPVYLLKTMLSSFGLNLCDLE